MAQFGSDIGPSVLGEGLTDLFNDIMWRIRHPFKRRPERIWEAKITSNPDDPIGDDPATAIRASGTLPCHLP